MAKRRDYYKGGHRVLLGGVPCRLARLPIGPAGIAISGTMVMINSGGAPVSGSPAQLQSPGAPTAPDVADDGTKGGKLS